MFFIIKNIGDRDTDTHRYTKLGHVCDPGDYRTQIHTDTQNWVTYVTRNTKGHGDTKLGHVCDPGGFDNIDHNGTRVTGSRWSRWSRCVFSSRNAFSRVTGHRVTLVTWVTLCFFSKNAFSRVTGTRHTRRSHLALFCPIMSHICKNNKIC